MRDSLLDQACWTPERLRIYTDGACAQNPGGQGGWAAIVVSRDGTEQVLSGEADSTTNNRMEIMGALAALQATGGAAVVVSDSRYLVDGASTWMWKWERTGWRTKTKSPVKNRDLWEALLAAVRGRDVVFQWVLGHNGHPYNERCDRLANLKAGLSEDV